MQTNLGHNKLVANHGVALVSNCKNWMRETKLKLSEALRAFRISTSVTVRIEKIIAFVPDIVHTSCP